MMRLYAAIHRELEDSLLPDCAKGSEEDVPRSKRRKRNNNSADGSSTGKGEATDKSRPLSAYQKPRPVATKNFYAPLRAVPMEVAEVSDEASSSENTDNGRPHPIVLTSEANLLSHQKNLRTVVNGEFFFRNTASRIRITTKTWQTTKPRRTFQVRKIFHSLHSTPRETNQQKLSSGIYRVTPRRKILQWPS
jgi:hypothetical protein